MRDEVYEKNLTKLFCWKINLQTVFFGGASFTSLFSIITHDPEYNLFL